MYTDVEGDLSVWGCTTSSGLTESIVINAPITMSKETSLQVVSRTTFISPSLTGDVGALVPSDSNLSLPTMTSESTKSNVGAIAGGVVGGLAVVVLGGLGLFLVLSRRKKKAAAQGQTAYQPGVPPAQPMMQQPPMQPMHSGGYPDQNWNNQAYVSAAQPQMMPQQQGHEIKYTDSEVTTPVNGPPQYGAQQQQYYSPQQQGYYAQQPQQPQQLVAPTELPDRQ